MVTTLPFLEICRLWWDRDFSSFPSDNIGQYRYNAQTKADYYDYILDRMAMVEDAYFPFYTPMRTKEWLEEQKEKVIINRLFIDIDVREKEDGTKDTFEEIWEKAQFFAKKFWPNIDFFFSAGKGFHFYIHINPTTYGELRKQRETLYWNLSTWVQSLIDKRTFISLDRVCRITLTKHSVDPDFPTPIRWKVPVTPEMSMTEILRYSQFPTNFKDDFLRLYERPVEPLDWRIFLKSPHLVLQESLLRHGP
jgi:hypothetical protein